jgi:hypothetical protein
VSKTQQSLSQSQNTLKFQLRVDAITPNAAPKHLDMAQRALNLQQQSLIKLQSDKANALKDQATAQQDIQNLEQQVNAAQMTLVTASAVAQKAQDTADSAQQQAKSDWDSAKAAAKTANDVAQSKQQDVKTAENNVQQTSTLTLVTDAKNLIVEGISLYEGKGKISADDATAWNLDNNGTLPPEPQVTSGQSPTLGATAVKNASGGGGGGAFLGYQIVTPQSQIRLSYNGLSASSVNTTSTDGSLGSALLNPGTETQSFNLFILKTFNGRSKYDLLVAAVSDLLKLYVSNPTKTPLSNEDSYDRIKGLFPQLVPADATKGNFRPLAAKIIRYYEDNQAAAKKQGSDSTPQSPAPAGDPKPGGAAIQMAIPPTGGGGAGNPPTGQESTNQPVQGNNASQNASQQNSSDQNDTSNPGDVQLVWGIYANIGFAQFTLNNGTQTSGTKATSTTPASLSAPTSLAFPSLGIEARYGDVTDGNKLHFGAQLGVTARWVFGDAVNTSLFPSSDRKLLGPEALIFAQYKSATLFVQYTRMAGSGISQFSGSQITIGTQINLFQF